MKTIRFQSVLWIIAILMTLISVVLTYIIIDKSVSQDYSNNEQERNVKQRDTLVFILNRLEKKISIDTIENICSDSSKFSVFKKNNLLIINGVSFIDSSGIVVGIEAN